MTLDRVLDRVVAIVARIAGPQRIPPDATPDTPLGEAGYWLDSVDLLEVTIACEHEFGVTFDVADDLGQDRLGTARSLAQTIHGKMA